MYGVLQRRYEKSGTDEQERLLLSFDRMFVREKGSALGKLFDYWREKQAIGGKLPVDEEFHYQNALPNELNRFVCWADVSSENPTSYITGHHANLSTFGNHSNRRLVDHPSKMNGWSCMAEYMKCIRSRRPFYHEIEQTIDNNHRHYFRLMLPIADPNDHVTKLIYAVRIERSSERPGSPEISRAI